MRGRRRESELRNKFSAKRHRPLNPSFSPHAGRRSRKRRGRANDTRSHSRDALAPEVCRPKPPSFCLQKNKGRRSAGRRNCPVGPRHAADVAIHLRFGRRPRAQRSALASRRSTAALSEVSRPRLFDFRPGFLGRGSWRALPALSCPSPAAAPRAPAVIPVDMMPEAARERTVSVRPRAPLSLRDQEHPHDGVPCSSEMAPLSAKTDAAVKRRRQVTMLRPCKLLESKLFCAISQKRERPWLGTALSVTLFHRQRFARR